MGTSTDDKPWLCLSFLLLFLLVLYRNNKQFSKFYILESKNPKQLQSIPHQWKFTMHGMVFINY